VTVMFDRYFGIPQHVIRTGLWADMKPSEQSLYVCLLHESERYSTREIQRTDAAFCKLSGLSSRAFCTARKRLQERRLLLCRRGKGNVYIYTICNPESGTPWPGDPKKRIAYRKKHETGPNNANPTVQNSPHGQAIPVMFISKMPEPRVPKIYGVPLKF
jgi:hypothetical protein